MTLTINDINNIETEEYVDDQDYYASVQRAINAGSWGLQGSYGRTMMAAIDQGYCVLGRCQNSPCLQTYRHGSARRSPGCTSTGSCLSPDVGSNRARKHANCSSNAIYPAAKVFKTLDVNLVRGEPRVAVLRVSFYFIKNMFKRFLNVPHTLLQTADSKRDFVKGSAHAATQ